MMGHAESRLESQQRPPLISVVICTYNRAALLKEALQTTCAQTIAADCFEILVVDNGSADATAQVVADFCRRAANVRYLVEPQVGLATARNRGWQAAQGTYIAYLDDDCQVPPTWLEQAQSVIEAQAPGAMIGPFYAIHRAPPPPWWRAEFDQFHSLVYATAAGDLPAKVSIGGVSLFIRQEILQQTGGFDQTLGMKGRQLGYEEDSDLGRRIRHVTGKPIYYDPSLWVYHLVRTEKLSLGFLISDQFARSRFYYRAVPQAHPPSGWPKALLRGGKVIIKFLYLLAQALLRNRQQTPYIEQYLYGHRGFRSMIWQMGQVYEYLSAGRAQIESKLIDHG